MAQGSERLSDANLADESVRSKPTTLTPDGFLRAAIPAVTFGRIGAIRARIRTPGKNGASHTMPRFVILEHDHPLLHWDLMLEAGPVLRTWRLAAPPHPGEVIAATAMFDHRLLYLDYEGPLSGGRGRVVRWEYGTFTGQVQSEPPIIVHLQGEHLHGVLRLEQIKGDAWCASMEESGPEV